MLKVPHHDSDTSSAFDFIMAVAPLYAIVSYDSSEDPRYPSLETAMTINDCDVGGTLTTAAYGDMAITVTSNGKLLCSAYDNGSPDASRVN
ncbi:MAG: hypothetical protein RSD95_12720 [Clostridia bacterium]